MKLRHFVRGSALVLGALAVAWAADFKNPWESAKAGQWITSKTVSSYPGMPNPMTNFTHQWVEKVEGKKVTYKMQMLKDEKTPMGVPATPITIDLEAKAEGGKPAADAPKPKISEEETEISGKKVKCTKIETESQGNTYTTWYMEGFPFDVKMTAKDKDGKETTKKETLAWGETGGEEKK